MSIHIIEPLIPGRSSAGTAEQSISHSVLDAPSFPRGSIGPRSAWQSQVSNGFAYYQADDGGSYVGITRNNRVWQDIDLPVAANPASEGRPDYWLGCQYNATWFGECMLSVYLLEGPNETDLLYRQPMRGEPPLAARRALFADPTWHELSLERIAVPADARRLRVVFETPDSVGRAYLYIRDVVSQLRLPALAGEVRLTVDPDGSPIEQSGNPLLLCHGAEHRLEVKAQDGNDWQEQKLSLLWMNVDEHLPVEFGVHTTPALNLNDNDHEESYQPLPASTGAHWDIHAQAQEVLSGEVTLGLGSYWQALKHELPMQVGDFRYDVVDLQWDGVVPIVELDNSTRLSAVVKSPFAPERMLGGKAVTWLLNDQPYRTMVTDEQGRAELYYKPVAGDAGPDSRVVFKVSCEDTLRQSSEQTRAIPVFLASPWAEQLDVLFDDELITDFDALSLRLTSIGSHTLTLRPKRAGGFFDGLPVTLQWPDGQPQLGIGLSPTTAQTMSAQGVSWQIVGGDEQGTFNLEAVTPELNVPLSLRGVRMSASLADEVDVFLAGEPLTAPAVFRRGEVQTLSIVPKPGSALGGMAPDTWLSFIDASLGPADVAAVPAYGSKQVFQPQGLSWELTGADLSGTFGLQVQMDGFAEPLVIDICVLLSCDLSDEVELSLDGTPVSEGSITVLRRRVGRALHLAPKASSPLGQFGFDAWLTFVDGSLAADSLLAMPVYDSRKALTTTGLDWSLTGQDVSGTFGLALHVEGFRTPMMLKDCVLLSANLDDEVSLELDHAPSGPQSIFWRNRPSSVSLVLRDGSPLAQAGLHACLVFNDDTLSAQDVTAVPNYDIGRAFTAPVLEWSLTGQDVSGKFSLSIHVDGFESPVTLGNCLLLASDLGQEAELLLDNVALIGATHVFRRNERSNVGFRPRDGSPLQDSGLSFSLAFIDGSLSSNDLVATPTYNVPRALVRGALEWSLAGRNTSGTFSLRIDLNGTQAFWMLSPCMLVSRHLIHEAELELDGVRQPSVTSYDFRTQMRSTLRFVPRAGSPLRESGLPVSLHFTYVELSERHFSSAPGYGVGIHLGATDPQWNLLPTIEPGRFRLHVEVPGFPGDRPLIHGRVIPR